MATFAVTVTFIVDAKNWDRAEETARNIGDHVDSEKLASEYSVVDIEQLEDDEDDKGLELDEENDE